MKIFHIASTPIRVHWTLLALTAGLMTWQYTASGISAAMMAGGAVACVFATVFLHELAHSLVARDFGYSTESITLYPFGGIARIEMPTRVPPRDEIYICLLYTSPSPRD